MSRYPMNTFLSFRHPDLLYASVTQFSSVLKAHTYGSFTIVLMVIVCLHLQWLRFTARAQAFRVRVFIRASGMAVAVTSADSCDRPGLQWRRRHTRRSQGR